MMDGGRIVEQGSYASLLSSGQAFSRLIAEYGSSNTVNPSASPPVNDSSKSSSVDLAVTKGEETIEELEAGGRDANDDQLLEKECEKHRTDSSPQPSPQECTGLPSTTARLGVKGAEGAKLMQAEDRQTGGVSWVVYKHYARSMGSYLWAPLLFGFYAFTQIATVGNTVFLGFWSAQSIEGFGQVSSLPIIWSCVSSVIVS